MEASFQWFEIQSQQGLIGEIDYLKSRNGVIVCLDGFKATTFSEKDFRNLVSPFDVKIDIAEVDHSSLFCEMEVI